MLTWLIIILVVVLFWCAVSLAVGLIIGGAVKLRDRIGVSTRPWHAESGPPRARQHTR